MHIEKCPYRAHVRRQGEKEMAGCQLLQIITGISDSPLCEVSRGTCDDCCRSYPPSPTSINPVVASNLFLLTREIIEKGGASGCDVGKAAGIKKWAEANLDWAGRSTLVDYQKLTAKGVAEECCYLGDPLPAARGSAAESIATYECRHPQHTKTTARECYGCRDWAHEPHPRPPRLQELGAVSSNGEGIRFAHWAVGVTTAPRQQPTLSWCLDSLTRAGWREPRIFMDSPVSVAERHEHLPVSLRESRLGAWPNYYLAMVELLMRAPEADAYFLLQDDVLLYDHENLREYLESLVWSDEVGAVSLYSSRAYTQERSGWHVLGRRWVWGALAFIFPRESAKRFVADLQVLEHRWSTRNDGCANIDAVIGQWASHHKLKMYFPTPSLAQHIGDMSTLWQESRADGHRRADRFAGD